MAQSKWKPKFFFKNLYKFLFASAVYKNKNLGILYNRSSIIPELLQNKSAEVYKGQEKSTIHFNKYMSGYKIGEFAFTRKNYFFPQKKKKKKK